MNLLLGYLFLSFFAGVFLWRRKPSWRAPLLFLMCLFISFAYLYLNQL